jgi:subtilisin family serine protease
MPRTSQLRPSRLVAATAALLALSVALASAGAASPLSLVERALDRALRTVEAAGSGIVQHETGAGPATYVVVLAAPPLALYDGSLPGLAATSPLVTGGDRLDATSAAARTYVGFLDTLQGRLLDAVGVALGQPVEPAFRYTAALNGVALELTPAQARVVSRLPGVARVVRETPRWLTTDNGPRWIGADVVWGEADAAVAPQAGPGKATPRGHAHGHARRADAPALPDFLTPAEPTKGEGVVVGIIDTGINHDHPSFAATSPDGYVHTNPRGRFFGLCALGGSALVVSCNDKLIGIHDFTGTGPEDDNGHGSHVAGTAVGNPLDAALVAPTITVERPISGVAPRANLISYKGCSGSIVGCQLPSLLAAINMAVLDGVDVINYSICGGSADPWTDLDALSFLGARAAGIVVATSAGNSGPGAATVGSPADAPWVMTVAASTHDRNLVNAVVDLDGPAGPLPDIEGKSLTAALDEPAPVVYAGDFGNALCASGSDTAPTNPFAEGTFDGKIVLCDRGLYARVDKARMVAEAGAVGFILANDEPSGDSLVGDAYALPGVHISYTDGLELRDWIAASGGEGTARITGTEFAEDAAFGDEMASFSSRGPNPSVAGLLKPDITGPGVDILAAWTSQEAAPAPIVGVPLPVIGLPPTGTDPEFGIISGTSMSSPHLAGAAALLRALHPDWSPDAVKSALMTTAFDGSQEHRLEVRGIVKEDGETPADPFDVGAGRVALERAHAAALVVEEDLRGYLGANPLLGGDPRALNLPSLADAACDGICTWTRTVTSTADRAVAWTAAGELDGGGVTVTPETFTLEPGGSVALEITADVHAATGAGHRFGVVRLTPDAPLPAAHLPVAVRPANPAPAAPGEGGEPAQGPITETVLVPAPGLGVEIEPLTAASFTFEVLDGFDNAALDALAEPALPADVDLFLDRRDGDAWVQVADGMSGSLTEERLSLAAPAPGEYRLRVVSWAGVLTSVDVTVTFTNSAGEPGAGPAAESVTTTRVRGLR